MSKAHAAVRGWGGRGWSSQTSSPPSQQDIAISRKVLARLAIITQPQQMPKTENLLDSRGYQPFYELGPPPAHHKDFLSRLQKPYYFHGPCLVFSVDSVHNLFIQSLLPQPLKYHRPWTHLSYSCSFRPKQS